MNPAQCILVHCLIALMPCAAQAPVVRPATQISYESLATNSITLGSTRSKVIAELGEPISSTKGQGRQGKGSFESFQYDGLSIRLESVSHTPIDSDFRVTRLVISKSKWKTKCGLHVGSSEFESVKLLGKPNEVIDVDERGPFFHYFAQPGDSWVDIFFSKGLISQIELVQDPSSP